MQLIVLAAVLAVPTAFGLSVFLALLVEDSHLADRPVLATIGTTLLLSVPALAHHYQGLGLSLGIVAFAGFLSAGYRAASRSLLSRRLSVGTVQQP